GARRCAPDVRRRRDHRGRQRDDRILSRAFLWHRDRDLHVRHRQKAGNSLWAVPQPGDGIRAVVQLPDDRLADAGDVGIGDDAAALVLMARRRPMGNLWLKIKVWTKITIAALVAIYLLIFILKNGGERASFWWWFGRTYDGPLLYLVLFTFIIG